MNENTEKSGVIMQNLDPIPKFGLFLKRGAGNQVPRSQAEENELVLL